MKKLLLVLALSVIVFSCNKDENNYEKINDSADLSTVISPTNYSPNASFDDDSRGVYHGFILSQDSEFNHKIWINIENNGSINAVVAVGKEIEVLNGSVTDQNNIYRFQNQNSSFELDINDLTNPIARNVVVHGQSGYVRVLKDRAQQRVATMLGTYEDFADPAFTGAWNLISDGTPAGSVDHASGTTQWTLMTEVHVCSPSGNMFTDTTMEGFEFECLAAAGTVIPPLFAVIPTVDNELIAANQVSQFGNTNALWDIGVSAVLRDFNAFPDSTNGFFNRNLNDGTPGCNAFNIHGLFNFKGRVGFMTFPFDVPIGQNGPPPPPSFEDDESGQETSIFNPVQGIEASVIQN